MLDIAYLVERDKDRKKKALGRKYLLLTLLLKKYLPGFRLLGYYIEPYFDAGPSIRDWVLHKRGLDGNNSCLKFLFNFRKRKLYIFELHFTQLFSVDAKIFFKKISKKILTPKT